MLNRARVASGIIVMLGVMLIGVSCSNEPTDGTKHVAIKEYERMLHAENELAYAKDYLSAKSVEADKLLAQFAQSSDEIKPYIEGLRHYRAELLKPLPGEVDPLNINSGISLSSLDEWGTEEYIESLREERRSRVIMVEMMMDAVMLHKGEVGSGVDAQDEARLIGLVPQLGMDVPDIILGNTCGGSNTLGCYFYSGKIELTPLSFAYDDCVLLNTIAHETRHYQQHINGTYLNMSVDEMEEDAHSYAREATSDLSLCEA